MVARRNARGGRSAAEHLIAALRCLYRRAVADGHLTTADNPAAKVDKPRRLPSTRRAIGDTRPSGPRRPHLPKVVRSGCSSLTDDLWCSSRLNPGVTVCCGRCYRVRFRTLVLFRRADERIA